MERRQILIFHLTSEMQVTAQRLQVVIELGPATPTVIAAPTACESFDVTGSRQGGFMLSPLQEQSFSVRFDAHKGERIRWTITAMSATNAPLAYKQGSFILEYDKTDIEARMAGVRPSKGGFCGGQPADAAVEPSPDAPVVPDAGVDASGPEALPGPCNVVTSAGCGASTPKCELDCNVKENRCGVVGTKPIGAACLGPYDCAAGGGCACSSPSSCLCYQYCNIDADCAAAPGTACVQPVNCPGDPPTLERARICF